MTLFRYLEKGETVIGLYRAELQGQFYTGLRKKAAMFGEEKYISFLPVAPSTFFLFPNFKKSRLQEKTLSRMKRLSPPQKPTLQIGRKRIFLLTGPRSWRIAESSVEFKLDYVLG